MNRRQMMTSAAAVLTSSSVLTPGISMSAPASTRPVPPVARKTPKRIEQLGRVRVDDYAWMKDDNWQKVLRDPSLIKADVKEHLTAENAYTKAMLAPTEALQTAMFEEMKGRIKQDDASVPRPRRRLGVLHALRDRRSASDPCAQAQGRRRRADPAERRDRVQGQGLLPGRRRRPFARPQALCLRRRRAGLGSLSRPRQGPGQRQGAGKPGRKQHRRLLFLA